MINIIVAVAEGGVIGGDNRLLWHISEDLRHFKAITSGHPVVMGRKTFESLGRPLPNRENVVITRSDIEIEGCRVVHSLEEALSLYKPQDQVFIIGGAQIYGEAMPLADRFYLTRVEHSYEGDTLYPEWDESEWECVSRERMERGEKYEYPFVFEEYRRIAKPNSDYHICQVNRTDIGLIRELATKTFEPTYREITPADMIVTLFEEMYSVENINKQFDKGYQFFILYHKSQAAGYLALERQGDNLVYLHRLYILPEMQGRGYGRILIEYGFEASRKMIDEGVCRVELRVNKYNRAFEFYKSIGMQVAYYEEMVVESTDFIRPDYIMYIEV